VQLNKIQFRNGIGLNQLSARYGDEQQCEAALAGQKAFSGRSGGVKSTTDTGDGEVLSLSVALDKENDTA